MVLVVYEKGLRDEDGNGEYVEIKGCLLAFNLEDHSIQRIEIEDEEFEWHNNYSFLKYSENQIIKYAWNSRGQSYDFNLICITVESFERILYIFLKQDL